MTANILAKLTPEELNALKNVPALQPPAGILPNFADAENQNQPLLIVTSILLGIMVFFIVNRLYSKTFISRKFSWDDLTVSIAVLGSVAYYVACIWGAQRGRLGVHEWDINIPEAASRHLLIPCYLIAVLPPPTMFFTKVTFFFLYLQIFQPMRWLRICAYIGAVLTTLFYLGMTVAQFIFSTLGVSTRGEELSLAMSVPQSSVGLVIDLYILLLPIVAVSKLQLPTRRKIGVMLIFMTGLMACLSSAISIYYRNILAHTLDVTWALMPVNTATLTEMFVGIICSCVPSAAHSFRHHLPAFRAIKTIVYYRFESLGSTLRRTGHSAFTHSEKATNDQTQGPYASLDSPAIPLGCRRTQDKSVPIFVKARRDDDVENLVSK